MLLEFSFANFRSFRGLTTLSMVAAKISSKYKELDINNVFKADTKLNLLKSKAIYGQNASGKSNIVKALVTFLMIVRHSVKSEEVISKLATPFQLSSANVEEPTFFQIKILGDVAIVGRGLAKYFFAGLQNFPAYGLVWAVEFH